MATTFSFVQNFETIFRLFSLWENFYRRCIIDNRAYSDFAFSALTLLVGHQEEHLACK